MQTNYYLGKTTSEDIIEIIERKKKITRDDISFLKEQIVTLDAAKEPYQAALNIIDNQLLSDINKVNQPLYNIKNAYQDRIDAGSRTTLFWNYDGIELIGEVTYYNFTCLDARKCASGNSGIGLTQISYVYVDGFTVGITTIPVDKNGRVANEDDLPLIGIGITSLHGLKLYSEPYTKDILDSSVEFFPGSVGIITGSYSVGFVSFSYSTNQFTTITGDFVSAGIQTGDIIYVGLGYTYGYATVSAVPSSKILSVGSTANLSGQPISSQNYFILQGADFNTLNVLAPLSSVTGLQTGQIIKSVNKPNVFPAPSNTIIGIGTTVADLSIVSSGYSTNATIYQLTLEDPFILPAQAPEPEALEDGSFFVEFQVLIDPKTVSNSLAIDPPSRPKGKNGKPVFEVPIKSPYTKQQISRYTSVNTDKGVRIKYHRSTNDSSTKKWDHFLEGFPDPDRLNDLVYVKEPKVGSGTLYNPIGFTQAPTNGFGTYAKEGDTLSLTSFMISLYYEDLPNNPTLNSAITQRISEKNSLEQVFYNNLDPFLQKIRASNVIRDDVNELNIRIWGCRVKLGESLDNLSKYNIRIDAVLDPSVLDTLDTLDTSDQITV